MQAPPAPAAGPAPPGPLSAAHAARPARRAGPAGPAAALGLAVLLALLPGALPARAPGAPPGPPAAPGLLLAQAATADAGPTSGADPAPASAAPPTPPAAEHATEAPQRREGALWQPAAWDELPGWGQDRLREAWPALRLSCRKPAPGWEAACASALALGPVRPADPLALLAGTAEDADRGPDEASLRDWLQRWLRPWRLEALPAPRPEARGLDRPGPRPAARAEPRPADDPAVGLLTGYFEPLLQGRRQRAPGFEVALHLPPAGLVRGRPWFSRAEIARRPDAQAALAGREIAWLADPLDLLLVQIQGSGRLRLLDEPGPDGQPRTVRLAFAAHNGQGYVSVGRWLVERGALSLEQASWPGIRAWAQANPDRVLAMMEANPRVVFFREEPLPDPERGPQGAQGLPLSPGRSIAVDPSAIPYGTPVWLASTEPAPWPATGRPEAPKPLQRLVIAQDTGGAIVGAVRADYFAGWGPAAEDLAGRLRQPLRLWALWPREGPPAGR